MKAQPCPKCGRPWIRWAGSALTCHAVCVFSESEQDEMMRRFDASPALKFEHVATEYGVTAGVIRASVFAARKRAGRKVSAWGR